MDASFCWDVGVMIGVFGFSRELQVGMRQENDYGTARLLADLAGKHESKPTFCQPVKVGLAR